MVLFSLPINSLQNKQPRVFFRFLLKDWWFYSPFLSFSYCFVFIFSQLLLYQRPSLLIAPQFPAELFLHSPFVAFLTHISFRLLFLLNTILAPFLPLYRFQLSRLNLWTMHALCTQNWAIYMDGFTDEMVFYSSAEACFIIVIKFTFLTLRQWGWWELHKRSWLYCTLAA